jgi:hypothetical protein
MLFPLPGFAAWFFHFLSEFSIISGKLAYAHPFAPAFSFAAVFADVTQSLLLSAWVATLRSRCGFSRSSIQRRLTDARYGMYRLRVLGPSSW